MTETEALEPTRFRPLPDGWRSVRLGEICIRPTGTLDPRSEPEIPFRYVDITSVDNRRKRIVAPKTLLGRDAPSRARNLIRANDVLVATTRPNLNAVALVPTEFDGQICSTGFCVLRASPAVDPRFLFAAVQRREFAEALADLVRGALYPAVTDDLVFAQAIPLPPLSEQRRIVAILNEQTVIAERMREAAEAQGRALEALPAAYLRRAFEGEL